MMLIYCGRRDAVTVHCDYCYYQLVI